MPTSQSLVRTVQARLANALANGSDAPLHRVEIAADVLSAQGELRAPIEAWVLGWDTTASPPRTATGPIRQLVKESVLVLVGFLYAGGAGELAEPEDIEDQIVATLLGWVPPGRAEGLSLRGSRLLRFDGETGTLFRQIVFETSRQRVAAQ